MEIRKTEMNDLSIILKIYDDARQYMRENGNLHQWAGGYPSREVVCADIDAGISYVCTEDDEIVGVFVFFEGEDPTYQRIYDGAWKNGRPYGVIHRIAVAKHCKGVASFCFAYAFAKCKNVKIDTHRDNIPMQKSLAKNGFTQCGIIYLASGDERLAYQKSGI